MSIPPNEKTLSDFARRGAAALTAHASVFLVPDPKGGFAQSVGSGTIVLTPGKRPLVLTAAHVIEGAERGESFRIGYRNAANAAEVRAAAVALHQDDTRGEVDVGVLVPGRELSSELEKLAVPFDVVASDVEVREHDWLQLTGIPREYIGQEHKRQLFRTYTHFCDLADPPFDEATGLMRVLWTQGNEVVWALEDDAPLAPDPATDPSGMSGGALWRFRPLGIASDELWSPIGTGQLIGVQRSWDPELRIFRIEPVTRWRSWLERIAREVDDAKL